MFQLIIRIAVTDPEEAAWMLGYFRFTITKKLIQQIKNHARVQIKKRTLYRSYRQGVKAK